MKKAIVVIIMALMIASALPIGLAMNHEKNKVSVENNNSYEENNVDLKRQSEDNNAPEIEIHEQKDLISNSNEPENLQEDEKIEEQENEYIPIYLLYDHHPNSEELNILTELGLIFFASESTDSVFIDEAPISLIPVLKELDGVIEVEKQDIFYPLLDVSARAIQARPSNVYLHAVWDELGYTGAGINIAILDTGVDDMWLEGHVAIDDMDDIEVTYDPKIIAGWDFQKPIESGDDNPRDDGIGHGSHCAGIALGTGGAEDAEFKGVAPGARLVDVDTMFDWGMGGGIIGAIEWCGRHPNDDWENDGPANNGISVMSMSIGGSNSNGGDTFSQAVNDDVRKGIVVVAATGNNGDRRICTPAAADLAIAVGAINDQGDIDRSNDVIAGYSNYGPRDDNNDGDPYNELKPDVVAPGTGITSVLRDSKVVLVAADGTSMACPHVAGVVALMLEANPNLKPTATTHPIKQILHETAEPRGTPYDLSLSRKYNTHYGFGIVEAYGAVKRAEELTVPGRLRAITKSPPNSTCYSGEEVIFVGKSIPFTRSQHTIEADIFNFEINISKDWSEPHDFEVEGKDISDWDYEVIDFGNNNWTVNIWVTFDEEHLDYTEVYTNVSFKTTAHSPTDDKTYTLVARFNLNGIPVPKAMRNILVKKPTAPDLFIQDEEISFTPNEPNEGDTVEIKAIIEDNGGINSDTEVNFYDGDPDDGGQKIGNTQSISVPASGSKTVTVNWDTTDNGGEHTIYVKIENTDPEESYLANNIENEPININRPPTAHVILPNGGEIWKNEEEIKWNAVDPDDDELLIDIFYSDNAGISWSEIAIDEDNDGIYTWDTKDVPNGDKYKIKIKAKDSFFEKDDESDDTFTIANEGTPPTIIVITPNGDEEWEGVNDIEWEAEGEGEIKIDIQYSSDAGENWINIAEDLPNKPSQYSWDTATVEDSEQYLIKIIAKGEISASDISDSVFTIYNPLYPTVTKILYPNGGETIDGSINIDWIATDRNKAWKETDELKIKIDYSSDAGENWINIATNQPNKKYLWDTTPVDDGENYKMRITATDPKGLSDEKESDKVFRIWNDNLSLEIIKPTLGDIYSGWEEINWTVSDKNENDITIKIESSSDGGNTWEVIKDNIVDDYLFFINPDLEEDLNREVISKDLKNEFSDNKYDLSNDARVKKLNNKKWKITDKDKVYIIKKEDGELNVYFPKNGDEWNTKMVEDGNNYKIRITASTDFDSKSVISSVFSVDNPDSPEIVLMSPNKEGEILNGIKEIKWKATDADEDELTIYIALLIYDSESDKKPESLKISYEEKNDGSYIWDTTSLPDWGFYKIQIQAWDAERNDLATSPFFEINNPDAPEIELISPIKDAIWYGKKEIKWKATDNDKNDELTIDIFYSKDAGENWVDIVKNEINNGIYEWDTTTVSNNDNYLIKIVVTEKTDLKLSDSIISDVFEIKNYDIEIEITGENEQSGKPGDTLEYEIKVTNLGNMPDNLTFEIEVKPSQSWEIKLTSNNLKENTLYLLPKPPGPNWENIDILITIPNDEEPHEKVEIIITATSKNSVNEISSNVTLIAKVERIYGLKIETDSIEKEAELGSEVIFNLTITNNGNERDTFKLSHGEIMEGWEVKFSQNEININAFNSKVVILSVIAPKEVDNLTEHGKLEFEVIVTSSNNTKSSLKLIVNGIEVEEEEEDDSSIPTVGIGILVIGVCVPLIFVMVRRRRY